MNLLFLGKPYIIAGLVSLILFYINNKERPNTKNVKNTDKKYISSFTKNNIKISIYLFIILIVILYLKDKLLIEETPENLEFKGGKPPF
jgi:Na+/melibiose symporter-like transporter